MDPNQTLRQLRRLAAMRHAGGRTQDEWDAAADELAELFEALDRWLSRGGFPPEAWVEGPDAVESTPFEEQVWAAQSDLGWFVMRGHTVVSGPSKHRPNLDSTPAEPLGPPNPAHGHLPEEIDLWHERMNQRDTSAL